MCDQKTSESALVTLAVTRGTPEFKLADVDALLEKLSPATHAALDANRVPTEALHEIAEALQDEAEFRYRTVRQRVIDVLKKYDLTNPEKLVTDVFDAVFNVSPADSAEPPSPEIPLPAVWSTTVNGVELLDGLRDEFKRYLSLPDHAAEAIALWVVHTYAHDLATHSPLLAITSPTKRCGKTTLLTLLGKVCFKVIGVSNMTTATLIRLIEQEKPTLLVDEADTFLRNQVELRGILNAGFSQNELNGVVRVIQGRVVRFDVWAPKAIACIGKLPDTLQDRAIEIQLQRRKRDERSDSLRDADSRTFNTLSSQAFAWVKANAKNLRTARPGLPEELKENDRACDKWYPLFAIADAAGGHWPATARAAAIALSSKPSTPSKEGLLLADLRDMFTRDEKTPQLPTTEILARLASINNRPWATFNNGRRLTPRELAQFLKRYGIEPKVCRFGRQTAKGYTKEDLAQAWERYAQNA